MAHFANGYTAISGGSATTPAYTFDTSANTGIYFDGTDLVISRNGTKRNAFTEDGIVFSAVGTLNTPQATEVLLYNAGDNLINILGDNGVSYELTRQDFGSKRSVRLVATGNVDIATTDFTVTPIDSVTPVAGDRILLSIQTLSNENGIYVVSAGVGNIARASDFDDITKFERGSKILILDGIISSGIVFYVSSYPTLPDFTGLAFVTQRTGDNLGNHIAIQNLDMNQTNSIINIADGTTAAPSIMFYDSGAANSGFSHFNNSISTSINGIFAESITRVSGTLLRKEFQNTTVGSGTVEFTTSIGIASSTGFTIRPGQLNGSGTTGGVTVSSGNGTGNANSGGVVFTSGGGRSSGTVLVTSGNASAISSGDVTVQSGTGGATSSGNVNINTGLAFAGAASGGISLSTGQSLGNTVGDISMVVGNASGTNTNGGSIILTAKNGTGTGTNGIIQLGTNNNTNIMQILSNGLLQTTTANYEALITNPNDIPNKAYVDSIASGLDPKESVRVKTDTLLPAYTAAGSQTTKTLTADANGAISIDGVTPLAVGERILVDSLGTATGADRGIYTVTDVGSGATPWILTRADDANEDSKVTSGLYTYVEEGTNHSGQGYVLSTNNPITLDTTSLSFALFSSTAPTAISINDLTDGVTTLIGSLGLLSTNVGTGANNTVVGSNAGNALTTGERNTFIGSNANNLVTAGDNNVAIGFNARSSGAFGFNTCVGDSTFCTNNSGVALGRDASCLSNQGIAIGFNANCSSNFSIAMGSGSVSSASAVAIGNGANATQYSIAIGENANSPAFAIGGGITLGRNSGGDSTSGRNIVLGEFSGTNMTTVASQNNILVGANSASIMSTGADNVIMGFNAAASLTTGSNNILMGSSADVDNGARSNLLVFDNSSSAVTTSGDNRMYISNAFLQNNSFSQVLTYNNTTGEVAYGNASRQPTLYATTANIADVAAGAPLNVDGGPNVQPGDRILVKDQTTTSQNGVYSVVSSGTGADGAWVRADDFDNISKFQEGTQVYVSDGTTQQNQYYYLSTLPATLNTDPLLFTELIPTAGASAINDLTDGFNLADNFALGHKYPTITSGDFNTSVGRSSGVNITSGLRNTLYGYQSGDVLTVGFGNTFIGWQTGSIADGVTDNNVQDAVLIGNRARTNGDNVVVIGAGTTSDGADNVIVGWASRGLSTRQVVIGSNCESTAADGVILGYACKANGAGGISIGRGVGFTATGAGNVLIGLTAGLNITSGATNTALGNLAGTVLTTGSNNVFLGSSARPTANNRAGSIGIGFNVQTAADNSFYTLGSGTSGVSLGTVDADSTVGQSQLALQYNLTTGKIGPAAGGLVMPSDADPATNLTGTDLVPGMTVYDTTDNELQYYNGTSFIGIGAAAAVAINDLTDGYRLNNNIALGHEFPSVIAGAVDNTVLGENAGITLTDGKRNTFIGKDAGNVFTTGTDNVCIGFDADAGNAANNFTVIIGSNARVNSNSSIAIGNSALCGSGQSQIAIGNNATANGSTTGSIAIGLSAQANDFASTAIGRTAVANGQHCISIGFNAGNGLSDGNILIGTETGNSLATGANNVIIGRDAGDLTTTGSNCVLLGSSADTSTGAITGSIALGSGAIAATDNSLYFRGNTATTALETMASLAASTQLAFQYDTETGKAGPAEFGLIMPNVDDVTNVANYPAVNRVSGGITFDTDDNVMKYWNGTQFVAISSLPTGTAGQTLHYNATNVLVPNSTLVVNPTSSQVEIGGTVSGNSDLDTAAGNLTSVTNALGSIVLKPKPTNTNGQIGGSVYISGGDGVNIPSAPGTLTLRSGTGGGTRTYGKMEFTDTGVVLQTILTGVSTANSTPITISTGIAAGNAGVSGAISLTTGDGGGAGTGPAGNLSLQSGASTTTSNIVFNTDGANTRGLFDINGQFLLTDSIGTAVLPNYSFTTDTNTGMWHSAADTIDFTTAGVNKLTLQPDGLLRTDFAQGSTYSALVLGDIFGRALVNKSYTDAYTATKVARVATVSNVATVSGTTPSTVDGIALAVNDLILVKDQTDTTQNNVWQVFDVGTGADGTWGIDSGWDDSSKFSLGYSVLVQEGTSAGTTWEVTTMPADVTINPLLWSQVTSGDNLGNHTATLPVQGITEATASVASSTNVSYGFVGRINDGMYSNTAGNVAFAIGGADNIRLNNGITRQMILNEGVGSRYTITTNGLGVGQVTPGVLITTASPNTSTSGAIAISTGPGTLGGGSASGSVLVSSGSGINVGNVTVTTGDSSSGGAGLLELSTGTSTFGGGVSGSVTLKSGDSSGGGTGGVTIAVGTASGTNVNGGAINTTAGNSTGTGAAGGINITGGTAPGTGNGGDVTIAGGLSVGGNPGIVSLTTAGGILQLGLDGKVIVNRANYEDFIINDNDIPNKAYVDSIAAGLDLKASVRVKTDAALPAYTAANGPGVGRTLTANANGVLPTIDGVTMVVGNRVLVTTEATATDVDNGIYEVSNLGAVGAPWILTRAADVDGNPAGEVTAGMFCFVTEGTIHANQGWVLTTNDPIIVDTSLLSFTQFSAVAGASAINDLTDGNTTAATSISLGNSTPNAVGSVIISRSTGAITGGSNTVIGGTAGSTLTTGASNTLIGNNCDVKTNTDQRVICIGASSSARNGCIGIGFQQGTESLGEDTIAIGFRAEPGAQYSIAIGYNSVGAASVSGGLNIGVGRNSCRVNNILATQNTCIGDQAGANMNLGSDNSFFGFESGRLANARQRNALYGSLSGSGINHGNDNTMIGYNTSLSAAVDDCIVIGSGAVGSVASALHFPAGLATLAPSAATMAVQYNNTTGQMGRAVTSLVVPAGTAALPGLTFEGDLNTGLRNTADAIFVSLGGVDEWEFISNRLEFQKDAGNAFIATRDVIGVIVSSNITVASGSTVTGNSGAASFISGNVAGVGNSGTVTLSSGTVGTNGTSGNVIVSTGNGAGLPTVGDIILRTGTGNNLGGNISILTQAIGADFSINTAAAGNVTINSASSATASSGLFSFTSGNSTGGNGSSGGVTFTTGNAGANSGNINLTTGDTLATSGQNGASTGDINLICGVTASNSVARAGGNITLQASPGVTGGANGIVRMLYAPNLGFTIEDDGTLSTNTPSYETLITNDDDIPNKKYVDDAVTGTDITVDVTTTDATPLSIHSEVMAATTTFGFEVNVSCIRTNTTPGSEGGHFVVKGAYRYDGTTVTQIGGGLLKNTFKDDVNFDITTTVVGNTVSLNVVGNAGKTLNWNGTVRRTTAI
jgi:hypothetical protein